MRTMRFSMNRPKQIIFAFLVLFCTCCWRFGPHCHESRTGELSQLPESRIFPDAACNGLVETDFQLYRELVDHFETEGALASVVVNDSTFSPSRLT